MTSYRIPFNRPALAGNELRYIQESVDSGRISGDGVFTEKCRRLLEELLGASPRPADDLLHDRPRDGRPAPRPRARATR